jgi:predicted nucleic-acid-binding Zn-ribbon protein
MPSTTKELSMDKQRQEQIISALKEKGAIQVCPRCRNLEFEVIGESMIPLTDRQSPLGGHAQIPTILVSCTNCGYIAQHATRLLELKR